MNLGEINKQLSAVGVNETKRLLLKEGKKLERIVRSVWRDYLSSYRPTYYERTGDTERGIKLTRVEMLADGSFGIRLEFLNDLMYHDSQLYRDGKTTRNMKGHSFMLISDGWRAPKLEKIYGKPVYRHTYYEGYNLIEKIKARYEAQKAQGIRLEVNWSGNYTK